MTSPETGAIRDAVREHYAAAARSHTPCCGGSASSAGTTSQFVDAFGQSQYDEADRRSVPDEALVASLGCGNPTLLADLSPGEIVLDLGSGGGIDVLLSARRVSPGGKVYGLDMTPEMVDLANTNKARAGLDNVEFLLGSIEDIPLPDHSVDVVISNCVVNLSADKEQVFREAVRVLRPGGRFAISDMVLSRPLDDRLATVMGLWTGCIAGALTEDVCAEAMRAAGFENVRIEPTTVFGRTELEGLVKAIDPADLPAGIDLGAAIDDLDGVIRSAFIRATAPREVPAKGAEATPLVHA